MSSSRGPATPFIEPNQPSTAGVKRGWKPRNAPSPRSKFAAAPRIYSSDERSSFWSPDIGSRNQPNRRIGLEPLHGVDRGRPSAYGHAPGLAQSPRSRPGGAMSRRPWPQRRLRTYKEQVATSKASDKQGCRFAARAYRRGQGPRPLQRAAAEHQSGSDWQTRGDHGPDGNRQALGGGPVQRLPGFGPELICISVV
jgi:hypothetical protein